MLFARAGRKDMDGLDRSIMHAFGSHFEASFRRVETHSSGHAYTVTCLFHPSPSEHSI